MALHDRAFPYRKHFMFGAVLVAMLLGITAPGQPLGLRLVAPVMAIFAIIGGFMVGWLVLKFQVLLWGRIAPRAVLRLSLAFFYLFFFGTLLALVAYPLVAGRLHQEGLSAAALALIPIGVGVAASAFRIYVDLATKAEAHS